MSALDPVERLARERRRDAVVWSLIAVLLLALSTVVFWLLSQSQDTSAQVEAQARAIAEAQKDDAIDSGIVRALQLQIDTLSRSVDPSAKDRLAEIERLMSRLRGESQDVAVLIPGPQGPRGFPGLPGADSTTPGPTGPSITGAQGVPGPAGRDGAQGPAGKDGADSTVPGPTGPAGADSTVPGPTGPAGPAGPAGKDGANGADGAPGADGRDGIDAFPFTFAITIPAEKGHDDTVTFLCTVTAPDAPGTCESPVAN